MTWHALQRASDHETAAQAASLAERNSTRASELEAQTAALQAELEHAKRTHEDAVMATQRADERRRQDETARREAWGSAQALEKDRQLEATKDALERHAQWAEEWAEYNVQEDLPYRLFAVATPEKK